MTRPVRLFSGRPVRVLLPGDLASIDRSEMRLPPDSDHPSLSGASFPPSPPRLPFPTMYRYQEASLLLPGTLLSRCRTRAPAPRK